LERERGNRRGRYGRSRRQPLPKPVEVGEEYDVDIQELVEVGEEYDVDIQELSRRGEGIARIKGLVTFIPNTKPGDHLKVRITRIGRRYAEARVVADLAES